MVKIPVDYAAVASILDMCQDVLTRPVYIGRMINLAVVNMYTQ